MLLAWGAVPLLVAFGFSWAFFAVVTNPRHVALALPPLVLLAGVGIGRLQNVWLRRCLGWITIVLLAAALLRIWPSGGRPDWAGVRAAIFCSVPDDAPLVVVHDPRQLIPTPLLAAFRRRCRDWHVLARVRDRRVRNGTIAGKGAHSIAGRLQSIKEGYPLPEKCRSRLSVERYPGRSWRGLQSGRIYYLKLDQIDTDGELVKALERRFGKGRLLWRRRTPRREFVLTGTVRLSLWVFGGGGPDVAFSLDTRDPLGYQNSPSRGPGTKVPPPDGAIKSSPSRRSGRLWSL